MSIQRKLHKLYVKGASKLRRIKDFALHKDPVDALISEVRNAKPEPLLKDRVVVITGSSSGIGYVLASAFLQKGARVVINGRRADILATAAKELGHADQLHAVCADVATAQGAQELLRQTLARFGAADVLINNAAVMGPKDQPAWDIPTEAWAQALAANLNGPFYCARAFMQWMVGANTSGRIINVSSGAANAPIKGLLAYAVSKSALDALTLGLAADADGTGIMVTGLQLGSTKTEMARKFFDWADYELLPPAETLVPAFWHAATADPRLLHGRVTAVWRFLMDRRAEAHIAKPMAVVERFRFVEQAVPSHIPEKDRIVLNRAENQFGMPQRVKSMLAADNTIDVSRYPDPDYGELRNKLAIKHQLPPQSFTFGNGSAELVERVLRVFTKPGEGVISNEPSWFMFDRFAYVHGVRNDKVPFIACAKNGFDHNLNGVLAAIRGDTRLIYLINPSNPVGVPLLHEPFARFLEQVPDHIPVIVDEAYVDFSDRADSLDVARLVLDSNKILIALRTFSKFYALAGMRIGYAFGQSTFIEWLDRGELLFNISTVAASMASAALDDTEHAQRTASNCSQERLRIMEFLRSISLRYVPTQSNMLMFEPPCAPEKLFDTLQQHGIVPARGVVLNDYVLWPVGLPDQNTRMMGVIRSCL